MFETIKSSREIDGLFERGNRASTPNVTILACETPEGRGPQGRVVVIAGKKTGNAVVRNRAKRVLRESVRRLDGPWAGYDVALIAKKGTASATPSLVDESVVCGLARIGVWQG